MNLIDKYNKYRERKREERLTDEIIKENDAAVEEALTEGIPAAVIEYIPNDDGMPLIRFLLEEMTCRMLPEVGSILWITQDKGVTRPHKVIRYDYMENGSLYDSIRVYVVTEPATTSDIMPNPRYLEAVVNG